MIFSGKNLENLVKEVLTEREWNKDSETPRDYSKEYNKPGSKEQDERNKRKRDKRKHDKEHGECPEETELHHVNGVESDEVKCQPVSKNRGRKEKSRLKDGEIVIRITEEHVRQIVQEETEEVLQEILPALAALAARGAAAASSGMAKAASGAVKITKPMAKKAAQALVKSTTKKIAPAAKKMAKKIGGTKVGSYQGLEDMIDQVLGQASDEDLKGNPNQLINKLKQSMPYLQHLKGGAKE